MNNTESRAEEKINKFSRMIFGKDYKDELDQKILNNKVLWLFVMILFIWNVVNQSALLDLKKTNHVNAQFPQTNYAQGEQVVGNDFANDAYFMSWGMYDIISFSKFTPKDIQKKVNYIANKMTATRYELKKKDLDAFVANVKKNDMKADFRIPNDQWEIMKEGENSLGAEVYAVTAKGDIFKNYGSYTDPQKECTFTIKYFRKGGITYVEDFGTDCF